MAMETSPTSADGPALRPEQEDEQPASANTTIHWRERELGQDGSAVEESRKLSDFRKERRRRRARYKKSITASWGLGEGVTGRMTGLLLLGLLVLTLMLPIAVYKMHRMQSWRQHAPGALSHHDQEDQQPGQLQDPTYGGVDGFHSGAPDVSKVPATPNLQAAFAALKHTGDHGLLLTVRGEDWDAVREQFLASVNWVAGMPPSVFESPYKSEETLRLMLAMDLACLENAAVEAKLAADDGRASHAGGYTEEIAVKLQRSMQARRQQAKAVDLWESLVVNDCLGSDPELKDSLLKLLLAVRSRAASSEYLAAAAAEVLFSAEPSARGHAEENRLYEGVAYIVKAGQLAATDSLIKTYVAPWLAIIFTSF